MQKEMTLDQLSRTTTKSNVQPFNPGEESQETASNPVGSGNGLKAMNISDLGKDLEAKHPEIQAEKARKEEGIAPEIVSDAFSALDSTIAEKKRNADAMVQQVQEAVEEQQFEAETAMEDGAEGIESGSDMKSLDDIEDDINKDLAMEDGEEAPAPARRPAAEESVMSVPEAPNMNASNTTKQNKPAAVNNTVSVQQTTSDDSSKDPLTGLDDLLKELDGDDTEVQDNEDETPEELREKFKANMGSIVVSKNPIDFSKYKISTKPVSSSHVLNNAQISHKKRADWGLLYSKRNVTFEECDGPELDALRKTIRNSNGVNGVIASLRFLYNHIVDANKPAFEQWTKITRTEDIESLYYAQYLACYADSNLIARVHEADNKTSLIDTDIYSMVKYENDEVKSEFESIRGMDSTTPSINIESTPLQISDNYVITYKPATLYSTFIQFATLKPEITEKYSDILNTMAYVDGFYLINRETEELIPIAIKEYPNNINKTVLSKLKVYTSILRTLSADQYNIYTGKLQNIIEDPKVTYVYPKADCPECGGEIPEEPVDSMLNLLFTRAQLAQVKNL